jgi:hypothetical protein
MLLAKLIGESDGYTVERHFDDEGRAVAWIKGSGLSEFDDQTARGEIWDGSQMVWHVSGLETSESRERNERRDAVRLLAQLNLTDKGRR